MVGTDTLDGKEESVETMEFSMLGIDNSGRSRNMGDDMAKVVVWKMTVFKQPGSSSKIWGGSTRIQSITNIMCHAKPDSISSSLALVGEDGGV